MIVQAALCVTFSWIFWALIVLVEEVESFEGWIPARKAGSKPFRYFEDWCCATWGDWLGVSLIDAAFGLIFSFRLVGLLLPAVLIAFCVTVLFHIHAMHSRHRPDSGYPKPGVISYMGITHIVYFFVQATVAAFLALYFMTVGNNGLPLVFAIGGAVIYILCLVVDFKRGAFTRLPKAKKR